MDIRKVKKLIELLDESGIAEIEITEGEESVRISRYSQSAPVAAAPPPMAVAAPAPAPAPVATSDALPAAAPPPAEIEDEGFLIAAAPALEERWLEWVTTAFEVEAAGLRAEHLPIRGDLPQPRLADIAPLLGAACHKV